MPYEHPVFPPFPDGSYGTYDSDTEGRGLGPVNVSGIQEWSASKSPYYSIGDAVSYKGLVYKLNYNWDGITVGSPDTQVDANGVRVWTLQCNNYLDGGQQFEMGYRATIGTGASAYNTLNLETTIIRYWNYWHNISSAHSTVFEQFRYRSSGQSGGGRSLLTLASTVEISPVNNAFGPTNPDFQSINFDDANGIDNKMFFFLTSSCGHTNGSGPWSSPWGVFQYYGGFKKNQDLTDVGTLYYEATYSYTLRTSDWRLSPEYNDTDYGPSLTINWTYTDKNGNVHGQSGTIDNLKMRFGAETFLGRTYTGAYRVYVKDGLLSATRWELDSVSPDMRTM